jgi:hypothetical protein
LKVYEQRVNIETLLHFSLFPTKIDFPAVEKILEEFYIDEAYKITRGSESKVVQLLNINHHANHYFRKKILNKAFSENKHSYGHVITVPVFSSFGWIIYSSNIQL